MRILQESIRFFIGTICNFLQIFFIILVANKVDLIDDERIDFVASEMLSLHEEFGFIGQFISAKTCLGIDVLDSKFRTILEKFAPEKNEKGELETHP